MTREELMKMAGDCRDTVLEVRDKFDYDWLSEPQRSQCAKIFNAADALDDLLMSLKEEIKEKIAKEKESAELAEYKARAANRREMSELTPERRKQRVAIANDIIETLLAGEMKVTTGTYFTQQTGVNLKERFPSTQDAQECYDFLKKTCSVCAIGAAAMSAIKLYDKVSIPQLTRDGTVSYIDADSESLIDVLAPYFDVITICAFECAFELEPWPIAPMNAAKLDIFDNEEFTERNASCRAFFEQAHNFGRKFRDDVRHRLLAIMQEVAMNNGEFLPKERAAAFNEENANAS